MHGGIFIIKTRLDRERKTVREADTLCIVAPLL